GSLTAGSLGFVSTGAGARTSWSGFSAARREISAPETTSTAGTRTRQTAANTLDFVSHIAFNTPSDRATTRAETTVPAAPPAATSTAARTVVSTSAGARPACAGLPSRPAENRPAGGGTPPPTRGV